MTREGEQRMVAVEEDSEEINREAFLQAKVTPKKRRACKLKAPLDMALLHRSKRLHHKDCFKEGDLAEPEDAVDVEPEDDNALAIVPVQTMSAYQIMGTSTLSAGSKDPHLAIDMVQAIVTNFLNMPATSVTREVLEAEGASPNV